jgi:hypothetical protein
VLGLDRMDGAVGQRLVERLQVGRAPEDHVGGVLHLHEAPVVAGREVPAGWTVPDRQPVQAAGQATDIEPVCQRLGAGEVRDLDERVVEQRVGVNEAQGSIASRSPLPTTEPGPAMPAVQASTRRSRGVRRAWQRRGQSYPSC